MESESILSEPNLRRISEQSSSMTILPQSSKSTKQPPRMTQLENLEAKMANIEVSLSATTPRRRKGTSLGGISIKMVDPREKESHQRSAMQDREAVIQSLRQQLGLEKLPRISGPAFNDSERPVAEQKLHKLRSDIEKLRANIRNLKVALEKLDISDNIDTRIRQAELEYALGREELQLLSLVEESRALESRLEKSKPEAHTIYGLLQTSINIALHAVQTTVGRWNANMKNDSNAFYVDWVLEGEGLCRGDRIIEVNGKIVTGKSREELQKLVGTNGKCELVVLRKRPPPLSQQQLQQSQADNIRLQHRISYLEEQVKELLTSKEGVNNSNTQKNVSDSHVTSISITSPPSTPPDNKPEIYQRGSFITTIVDGKPIEAIFPVLNNKNSNVTTTIIKECDKIDDELTKSLQKRNNLKNVNLSSRISINSENYGTNPRRERDKKDREIRRQEHDKYLSSKNCDDSEVKNNDSSHMYHKLHAKSVEYLNHNGRDKRRLNIANHTDASLIRESRKIRSFDFESDTYDHYASEPSGPAKCRPMLPKKPPRLSLQRAQSLQTVDGISIDNLNDKKRAVKRAHKSAKSTDISYSYHQMDKNMQATSLVNMINT